MLEIDIFYIFGKKTLIFRKEGEEFISFDPVNLEIIKLNYIGALILYLLSQSKKIIDIEKYVGANYSIDNRTIKTDIIEFIENYSCKNIITNILIKAGYDYYRLNQ